MGMKKKGRAEAKENLIINNSKKSLTVVMAAIIVSSALIASMPLAAANGGIDTFTIAPCRSPPDAELAYAVIINHASGFNSLTMSIPAGYKAKAPVGGEVLAEAWALDDGGGNYHMTFTANGTDKIDLHCVCGGDEVNYTFPASYGQGDSINISVSCWGSAYANLTLPTAAANGSLNLSLAGSSKQLKNVMISIKQFVQNPGTCDPYTFDVTANCDTASYTVCIMHPGDINGDCEVDVGDLQKLAWAWGSKRGEAEWNPCADLKCDDKIGVGDLQIMGWNFLKEYPCNG